jgi:hypothetical protein
MFVTGKIKEVRYHEFDVQVRVTEKVEVELLQKGRIDNALNILNDLEQMVNNGDLKGLNISWLENQIKSMASYDPNNKE